MPHMTENPYRLARDIRGIRFKTAGAIDAKPTSGRSSVSAAIPQLPPIFSQF